MRGEIQAEKKVVEIPIKNSAAVFKKETDTSNLKTEVQNAPSELLQKKTKSHLPVRAVVYQPTARYLAEEGIPVTNPNLLRAESALVPRNLLNRLPSRRRKSLRRLPNHMPIFLQCRKSRPFLRAFRKRQSRIDRKSLIG